MKETIKFILFFWLFCLVIDNVEAEKHILFGLKYPHYCTNTLTKEWILEGKKGILNTKTGEIQITKLFIKFLHQPLQINSLFGRTTQTIEIVEFIKNVILRNNQYGIIFLTDYIKLLSKKKVFITNSPITIIGEGFKIKGKGLKYFVDKKKCYIIKYVKMTIEFKKREKR